MAALDSTLTRVRVFCRIAVAAVFVLAGTLKLLSLQEFSRTVAEVHLFPEAAAPAVAFALTIGEISSGLAFLRRRTRRKAGNILIGLLALFTIVILFKNLSGGQGACGCFGGYFEYESVPFEIVRNLLLMFLTAYGIGPISSGSASPKPS